MAKKARRAAAQAATNASAPTARPTPPPDLTSWTEADRRYWPAMAVLFFLAAALRIFRLDVPAYQHDEAIYSIFSLNFHDYHFDPVYHGPVLYHIIKLFFVLFGDNDFVARMVSVVMALGTFGLVMGPVRRYLGDRAALFAMVLLAISPVMVTYQRRILFDAFVVLLTLGAVVLFHAAVTGGQGTWRWRGAWIGLAVVMTAFLATKANAFFVVAMLFSFWVLHHTRGVGPRDLGVRLPSQLPLLMFLAVSIAAAGALRDENKDRNERMLAVTGVVASALLWEWLRRPSSDPRSGRKPAATFEWPRPDALAITLSLAAAAFVFAFAFGHGYLWWQKPWVTIPQYWPDVLQAMPKMLEYWGGQQKVPRLPGRHDYYLPLMLLYELPIVIAFIGGVVRASRKRSPFTDLLLWWCFTSWTLYALANEKVPWLMTHLVAPFALLAGWWLAQLQPRGVGRKVLAAAYVIGAAYLLRNVSATCYERAVDNREPMFYAFTSESFKDTFFDARAKARGLTGDYWIYNAWPPSWWMRHTATEEPGAVISYDEHNPPGGPMRLVVCMEPDWEKFKAERFPGWHKRTFEDGKVVLDGTGSNAHILNWPRASWTSLRPDKWAHWFITREASLPESPDPFLTEWSHIPVVVATP